MSIRVLHIGTERSWRGGENQIRHLLEGLRDNPQIENFLAYPEGAPALERLQGLVPTMALPSSKAWSPTAIMALYQFCRTHQIQVIDAHSSGAHSLGMMLKRFLPKLKLVVHRRVDNLPNNKAKYKSPKVDQFVAISECIAGILKDTGVPESKIKVVRSAVNPDTYKNLDRAECRAHWIRRLGIPKDRLLVGNASAFTEQKGHDILIKALAELRDRTDFHCVIAGQGPLKAETETLAHELRLQQFTHFTGFIKDVPSLLSALDVLVMPSNWEGLGTLIQDALLAGCTVISTRVGGIPEMILHEKTGLLSDKGDVAGLAANLKRVLDDKELRQTLTEQGQKHLLENFSLQQMVQGNLAVYQSLVDTSTPEPQREYEL